MSDTYDDLIRRLREEAPVNNNFVLLQYGNLMRRAADAIEALVKERDEVVADLEQTYVKAYERGKQDGLRDGERRGLERAAKVAKYEHDGIVAHDEFINGALSIAKHIEERIRSLITTGEQSDDADGME